MPDLASAKAEFWGDLQVDLFVANTAIYLANQSLEDIIKTDGRKVHKPILSNPQMGTYVPHVDITFQAKTATDQLLDVDTFIYSAEDIDVTEKNQSQYDLIGHSSKSIRAGLMNKVEQKYLSEISNAAQSIDQGSGVANTPVAVSSTNFLDILEEAEGKLGAFDVSRDSDMRAIVLGPRTVAKLRRAKADRESRLGDTTLENGLVGPYMGWNIVENNNLPWSATLTIATQPTDGDTVTISGVTFTFKTVLGTTAGNVLIGADAAAARTNLAAAVNGTTGAGTTYVELGLVQRFIISRKRSMATGTASGMLFTGFGDIAVRKSLTAAADGWSLQQQKAIFMIRGAIDLVIQFQEIDFDKKEKGFADLVKGLIGVGTKTFDDGAKMMVSLTQDVSLF